LPLRPLVSQLPVVEELPDGLEEEIQRLKARLRRLGSVNPNAPAEYAEVQERYRFLTEQASDLETASAQLRQVVAELDGLMEAAFRETFDAVAARFSETFTTLFNGGSARLELTEPGDLMNTGVDIVARPPGKRAQRLALLSGGERALTAAASTRRTWSASVCIWRSWRRRFSSSSSPTTGSPLRQPILSTASRWGQMGFHRWCRSNWISVGRIYHPPVPGGFVTKLPCQKPISNNHQPLISTSPF